MWSFLPVVSVCLLAFAGANPASATPVQTPYSSSPPANPLNDIAKRLAQGVSKGATQDAATYTFAPTGGRLALDTLVDSLGEGDEQKKAIRTLLTEGFKAFENAAKEEGKANDVAAAFTFFIATHYSLSTGKTVSDAGGDALYKQVRGLFAAPEMKSITDADKQRFWETCVGMSVFTLGIAQAATDADTKSSLKKVAAASFESLMNVPVASVKITDKGIEVAGAPKADAVGSTANLSYAVPDGWTETKEDGGVLLNRTVKTDKGELVVNVMLMLGAAQSGNPNELCQTFYKKQLLPQLPADEVRSNTPLREMVTDVYRRSVGNGLRCYMTGNYWTRRVQLDYFGTSQEWHIYYVESGAKWVPVMVSMTGENGRDSRNVLLNGGERYDWLEEVLLGLKGTPSGKPLFTLAEVVGDFTTSSSAVGPMLYSTVTGGSVGMNAVSSSSKLDIKPTGAFLYQIGAATTYAGSGTRFQSQKDTGKVTITQDKWGAFLVRNGKDRTSRNRIVSASVLPDGRRMFATVGESDKPTLSFIWNSTERWITPENE
ncbi:MAG: hypothetical protein H7145_01295 [Akkermansiaceae bacterium]|nr:hypothetical protein [Armatimonadota bacterium]